MARLRRTRDGAGDSGSSVTYYWLEDGKVKTSHEGDPRVGVSVRVGSLSARSYSSQDWWQTSIITEILEESPGYIRFKTGNSEYEMWK